MVGVARLETHRGNVPETAGSYAPIYTLYGCPYGLNAGSEFWALAKLSGGGNSCIGRGPTLAVICCA